MLHGEANGGQSGLNDLTPEGRELLLEIARQLAIRLAQRDHKMIDEEDMEEIASSAPLYSLEDVVVSSPILRRTLGIILQLSE
jgi:hypothetical protein